jgi:hypothetical protein
MNNLNQKGVAALLTIVIIAAATLIMAFNSSLLGLGDLELGYTLQKGGEATSIADACIEETMRRLRLESDYSGGTLNIGENSCIINVESSGNNRTITTTSTVDIYHKKIKVTATLSDSNTTINTWQESAE